MFMAKYCIKCGKALPEGVEICPDCHVAAGETDAAPFTRITAQTEVWKDADKTGKKPKRRRVRRTRTQVQKRAMLICALLAVGFLVFAVLFTRPAPRVVRAIRGGDYDRALSLYWGDRTLAAEGSESVDKAVLQEAQRIVRAFTEHGIDADSAATALSKLGTFGTNAQALLADTFAEFRAMSTSQDHMEQAEKLFRNGEFLDARAAFLRVTEEDSAYAEAQQRAADCLEQYALQVQQTAAELARENAYPEAIAALEEGNQTLRRFGTFSRGIDDALVSTRFAHETFLLTEAERLAALGDYGAAAELLRDGIENKGVDSEEMRASLAAYTVSAQEQLVAQTVVRAKDSYAAGDIAAAFAVLDGLRADFDGDPTELDAAIADMEEQFTAETVAEAERVLDGDRDRLEEAIAVLGSAYVNVRPLESLHEYADHLRTFLPVNLAQTTVLEKSGIFFRSSSVFEATDGNKYSDGWFWGEDGASVSFRLDGAFDLLEAVFAVRREDDEIRATGRFEIWCDDEMVYESETLDHNEQTSAAVSVGISGCDVLRIVFLCDYDVNTSSEDGYCYHGICSPVLTKDMEAKP